MSTISKKWAGGKGMALVAGIPYPAALAIAVAISSFVALSLCPMLASRLPERENTLPTPLEKIGGRLSDVYRWILEFTLSARLLVLGGMALVALTAVDTYRSIDEELLPREDRGAIIIMMQGPDGVGLDYMDRQAVRAEALLEPLRERGEIENIFSIVGRWDLNRNYIIAPLTEWGGRRNQLDIAKSLRGPLKAIPGATARVRTPNSLNLRRAGGKLEFALTGPNYADIAAAADLLLAAIHEKAPQLDDPEIEYQQTQPQLTVRVNRRKAEDLDVSIEAISATLRAMVERLASGGVSEN